MITSDTEQVVIYAKKKKRREKGEGEGEDTKVNTLKQAVVS